MYEEAIVNDQPGTGVAGVVARVFLYGAVVAASALLLGLEGAPNSAGDLYSDYGHTERFQDLFLLLSIACFVIVAAISPPDRSLALLFAGMATMALIREADYFLDKVFDGLWQVLVTVTLAATVAAVWRWRGGFRDAVRRFTAQPAFGLLLSGFLVVFVFSRLYGEDSKWLRMMADSYERSVKNFAEEGVELLGYTLIMLAAMEFLYVSWRHVRGGRS